MCGGNGHNVLHDMRPCAVPDAYRPAGRIYCPAATQSCVCDSCHLSMRVRFRVILVFFSLSLSLVSTWNGWTKNRGPSLSRHTRSCPEFLTMMADRMTKQTGFPFAHAIKLVRRQAEPSRSQQQSSRRCSFPGTRAATGSTGSYTSRSVW